MCRVKKLVHSSVFVLIFIFGTTLFPDEFSSSYNRALVRQYDYFKEIEENKIVFVGTSSVSFGVDLDLMEELAGKTCVILGNYHSYGPTYRIEMSKSNLKEGDVVLVEFYPDYMDYGDADLLLMGLGKRYDMYRFFHPVMLGKIIAAYPSYLKKNYNYWIGGGYNATGAYSIDAFDWRGNYIYQRDGCILPEPYTDEVAKTHGWAETLYDPSRIDDEFIQYLNKYVSELNQIGVKVFIITPPCFDEALRCSLEKLDEYDRYLGEQLNAPVISRTRDHVFPRSLIYDGVSHCNSEGMKYQTTLLYNELKMYLQ